MDVRPEIDETFLYNASRVIEDGFGKGLNDKVGLEEKERSLVDAYAKIVPEQIVDGEITEGSKLDKNLIEQINKEKRRLRMELLVKAELIRSIIDR
jgi:hypothetical protein